MEGVLQTRAPELSGPGTVSMVLVADRGQYARLVVQLRSETPPLPEIGAEIERALASRQAALPASIPGAHRRIPLGDRPRVMGVVNVTPDSFSDGGRFLDAPAAIAQATRLVAEGADLVDLGAESTRPGASPVPWEEEWGRLAPVIDGVVGTLAVPISVDTRHPEVARRAVSAGADLVNDVEGLRSTGMRNVVAETGAAAIVVHMRGTPPTMQADLRYDDLLTTVYRSLEIAADGAESAGIPPERLLVDPGLGFGKSAEQSLELLLHLGELRSLGYPIVVGASRKSFLGWGQGSGGPSERLEAGLAAAVMAVDRGAAIVRTHDVAPTVRALSLLARGRAPSASNRP